MSATLNGNGNDSGNGHGKPSLIHHLEKRAAQARAIMPSQTVQESRVNFQTSDGVDLSATLTRVTQHAVYFELYSPGTPLRFSEVLEGFNIILQSECVYSGSATVRNVLDAGTRVVCEATLRETDWRDSGGAAELLTDGKIALEFKTFLGDWQKLFKVSAEFKVIMADMRMFLHDLRLWLERVELEVKKLPAKERSRQEREVARQLEPTIVPAIRNFFEGFEELAGGLDNEARPAYYTLGRRFIHALLLGSPFVNRTFNKPLGYAGDYEMVNMMFRDPFEGETLFAKMINLYALQLPPIVAHRNRISYLVEKLERETLRVMLRDEDARIFNLGCGPAHEVQKLLKESELANRTHFVLADFNQETLDHTSKILGDLKARYQRRGTIKTVKRPVQQLLKEAGRIREHRQSEQYDLIYCAGLFDYLSDQVCRQLMEVFYAMLLPGGLLIATNVDDHPAQNQMECFLDWNLVHRDEAKMRTIVPLGADAENVTIKRDPTGVNVFIEIRKPSGED